MEAGGRAAGRRGEGSRFALERIVKTKYPRQIAAAL